jgi:chromosome segregation ATPase
MTISIEQLNEEKALLQADFDKMNSQINKLTNDLAQMKANLNALNGAIQQVNKLIEIAKVETPEAKKLKESI